MMGWGSRSVPRGLLRTSWRGEEEGSVGILVLDSGCV